jgi:hypothetical protein
MRGEVWDTRNLPWAAGSHNRGSVNQEALHPAYRPFTPHYRLPDPLLTWMLNRTSDVSTLCRRRTNAHVHLLARPCAAYLYGTAQDLYGSRLAAVPTPGRNVHLGSWLGGECHDDVARRRNVRIGALRRFDPKARLRVVVLSTASSTAPQSGRHTVPGASGASAHKPGVREREEASSGLSSSVETHRDAAAVWVRSVRAEPS